MNFLGLPVQPDAYKAAKYVVLPLPYDATTSYRGGTRLGPNAVLDASARVEYFDEELFIDASACGIFTAEPIRLPVSGPADAVNTVDRACRQFIRDGKFILGLGGEHSMSIGIVRALAGELQHGKEPAFGVLQFDAHADMRDEYEGSPFSHGCVMRRIADLGLPIAQVGIRSFSQGEYEYMKANDIELFTPAAIESDPAWMDRCLARLPEKVYISVDIDGFDPAYAPGTGTPEPGGLNWAQVTGLIRRVAATKHVVGADIVEVTPVPGQHATEFMAARLAYKIVCYLEASAAAARRQR